MTKDKISIQEIIDLLAAKASVSKRVAEEFLKVFIGTIEEALIAGESVKIKNLGTFKLQWNAPRKSVNIKTGEEIILSGFHKVSFTPENALKELVNEPFAHLEAVVLDEPQNEKVEEVEKVEDEVELNPLRIFEEQASEIKDLISEIQALSQQSKRKSKKETTEAEDVEKNDDAINYISESIASDENEEIKHEENVVLDNEPIDNDIIDNNIIDNKLSVEDDKNAVETEKMDEINLEDEKQDDLNAESLPNPFIEATKTKKKRKKKLWVAIIMIFLLGGSISSYLFYPPASNFVNKTLDKGGKFIQAFKDNASTTDLLNTISKWVTPKTKELVVPETIIVPKSNVLGDSIIEEETIIDSLQVLFDTPRVYPEYIATEKIVSGSRLARMSERYYGKSDFWVYIYEANKNRIPNPDNIPTGTLIYIPKVDARLIDATNPRCLKKARELHDLYVKTDADLK